MDLSRSALDTILASDYASTALEEEAAMLEEQIALEEPQGEGLERSPSEMSSRLCEIYEELEELGGAVNMSTEAT